MCESWDSRVRCSLAGQGSFKRSVEKYSKSEKAKLKEIKVGWFTETAMATILKKTALGT